MKINSTPSRSYSQTFTSMPINVLKRTNWLKSISEGNWADYESWFLFYFIWLQGRGNISALFVTCDFCLHRNLQISSVKDCCSIAKSCPTLCNSMDCSIPGFSVLYHLSQNLLKLMPIELVMLSNHLILCCPLLLLPSVFTNIRIFSKSSLLTSHGQSIGVSASPR